MIKKALLAASATVALNLFIASARAADVAVPEDHGFYVSLFAGASFLDDVDTNVSLTGYDYGYSVDTKTGYIVGGALGMRIWDPLRAEVELSYARWKAKSYDYQFGDFRTNGDASGHLSATYLLGNLWIDIPTHSGFTPYVGGGAGVAWVDADTSFNGQPLGYGDGEAGFAFQLGAGVKLDITEEVALDVGYRYKGILDVDFEDAGGAPDDFKGGDLYSHNVQAGVVFKF
jgi:opacity protein-like surface antigen